MLNSPTFKISHYFTIPDPGKGLPLFERFMIQALIGAFKGRINHFGSSLLLNQEEL